MMSTDMIRFQSNDSGKPERIVHFEAIQFYIALSIPLTVATFLAWYGVYWCSVFKERRKGNVISAFAGHDVESGRVGPKHAPDPLPAL